MPFNFYANLIAKQRKHAIGNYNFSFISARDFPKRLFNKCRFNCVNFMSTNNVTNSVATSEWKFSTNATDFNRRRMKEQQNLASKFECLSWRRASRFDTSRILDPNIRRQLGRILQQGKCGLGDEKYLEVSHSANQYNISNCNENFPI